MAPARRTGAPVGGPGSIAEQSVDKGADVLLGGGKGRYDQLIVGGPDARARP